MKVKIISDSTSDLSPELVKKYDISIVPRRSLSKNMTSVSFRYTW